jgi:hypothetical protein
MNGLREGLEGTVSQVLGGLAKLVHEGNVRRITFRDSDGHSRFDFPLTLGVIGAAIAPAIAVMSAFAAVATGMKVSVERTDRSAARNSK